MQPPDPDQARDTRSYFIFVATDILCIDINVSALVSCSPAFVDVLGVLWKKY